jgi:hypothetical protein
MIAGATGTATVEVAADGEAAELLLSPYRTPAGVICRLGVDTVGVALRKEQH